MRKLAATLTLAAALLFNSAVTVVAETEEQTIAAATAVAEKARDGAARAQEAAGKARSSAAKARNAAEKARNLPELKRKIIQMPEARYVGEVRDGIPDGYGVWYFDNGSRYEGESRSNQLAGYGVFHHLSDNQWKGDRYEGQFRDSMFDGYGVYYNLAENDNKGDRYEGQYRDDMRDGYGVHHFLANNEWKGDRYEGEIRKGKIVGHGILFNADGARYDGIFRDSVKDGYAVYYSFGDALYIYVEDGEPDFDRSAYRSGIRAPIVAQIESVEDSPPSDTVADKQTIAAATTAAEKARSTAAKAQKAAGEARSADLMAREAAEKARNLPASKREEIRFEGVEYIGEVSNELPNGYGVLNYSDGGRYRGEFRDGSYQGYGVYIFPSGNRYSGEFQDDNSNGYGVLYITGGDRYEGEYRDGEINGYGIYYTDDGGRQEAQNQNQKTNGYAVDYYASGDRYEGEYRDDKKNGYGIYYFADGAANYVFFENGESDPNRIVYREDVEAPVAAEANSDDESPPPDVETEERTIAAATAGAEKARLAAARAQDAARRAHGVAAKARNAAEMARNLPGSKREKIPLEGGGYVGEVRGGIPNGYGVIHYGAIERYEGEFVDGNIIGYGVYYTADGSRQEAQFRDGEANGYGVIYIEGGDHYEGEFQNDKHNGYGIYYFDDGEHYEGEFTKNSGFDGYGVYYYLDGDRYSGSYRNGNKDGYGLFYGSSGAAFYAYFNNGELDPDRFAIRLGVNAPPVAERDSADLILINETFTARSNSNVRESPDASSRRITTIARGTGILVTGKVNGKNWYAVERDGNHFGYIWADLLEPNQPVREQRSQASSNQRLEESSSGTGFFISKDGHILTNAHVVEACRSVAVQPIGAPPQDTHVVSQDRGADLALLKSSTRPSDVATFREGKSVRIGNDVLAFGFPLSGLLSDGGNLTKGSITAMSGLGNSTSQVQISAPVQSGNSGGPLIDYSGNVVGVVVSKLSALKVAEISGDLPQNVNFAIKRRIVEAFLDSHDVDYVSAQSAERLDAADIAQTAKKYTVRVLCWE